MQKLQLICESVIFHILLYLLLCFEFFLYSNVSKLIFDTSEALEKTILLSISVFNCIYSMFYVAMNIYIYIYLDIKLYIIYLSLDCRQIVARPIVGQFVFLITLPLVERSFESAVNDRFV